MNNANQGCDPPPLELSNKSHETAWNEPWPDHSHPDTGFDPTEVDIRSISFIGDLCTFIKSISDSSPTGAPDYASHAASLISGQYLGDPSTDQWKYISQERSKPQVPFLADSMPAGDFRRSCGTPKLANVNGSPDSLAMDTKHLFLQPPYVKASDDNVPQSLHVARPELYFTGDLTSNSKTYLEQDQPPPLPSNFQEFSKLSMSDMLQIP